MRGFLRGASQHNLIYAPGNYASFIRRHTKRVPSLTKGNSLMHLSVSLNAADWIQVRRRALQAGGGKERGTGCKESEGRAEGNRVEAREREREEVKEERASGMNERNI